MLNDALDVGLISDYSLLRFSSGDVCLYRLGSTPSQVVTIVEPIGIVPNDKPIYLVLTGEGELHQINDVWLFPLERKILR